MMSKESCLERLWTPWRMEYILGEKSAGCIFCDKPEEDNDRGNLILYRGEKVFVIMNKYPYNNGHLMVTPYAHVSDLTLLDGETVTDLMGAVQRCSAVMKEVLGPEGFNVGMNIGKAGGAGIDDHLHMHIVPRWSGDTNFMTVMADTRVMPEYLDETYMKLYPHFHES